MFSQDSAEGGTKRQTGKYFSISVHPEKILMLVSHGSKHELEHLLFPQLTGKWAEVNLNTFALEYDNAKEGNTDPAVDNRWIQLLHKLLEVDYSWGGYMEHRDHLLRAHYMASYDCDHFWHLGIDYNVPVHTLVHLPCDGELVYAKSDKDQNGGWGGKLIFKTKETYLILGHLDQFVTEMRQYKKGEIVARVADSDENGNWFPHLHVQCMSKLDVEVDGYSPKYERISQDYPDPREMMKHE